MLQAMRRILANAQLGCFHADHRVGMGIVIGFAAEDLDTDHGLLQRRCIPPGCSKKELPRLGSRVEGIMKRRLSGATAVVLVFSAGLAFLPGHGRNTASAASYATNARRLGISELHINKTSSELQIVGLNSGKAQVAKLSLWRSGSGRKLTVKVRGQKARHESTGLAPLH